MVRGQACGDQPSASQMKDVVVKRKTDRDRQQQDADGHTSNSSVEKLEHISRHSQHFPPAHEELSHDSPSEGFPITDPARFCNSATTSAVYPVLRVSSAENSYRGWIVRNPGAHALGSPPMAAMVWMVESGERVDNRQ